MGGVRASPPSGMGGSNRRNGAAALLRRASSGRRGRNTAARLDRPPAVVVQSVRRPLLSLPLRRGRFAPSLDGDGTAPLSRRRDPAAAYRGEPGLGAAPDLPLQGLLGRLQHSVPDHLLQHRLLFRARSASHTGIHRRRPRHPPGPHPPAARNTLLPHHRVRLPGDRPGHSQHLGLLPAGGPGGIPAQGAPRRHRSRSLRHRRFRDDPVAGLGGIRGHGRAGFMARPAAPGRRTPTGSGPVREKGRRRDAVLPHRGLRGAGGGALPRRLVHRLRDGALGRRSLPVVRDGDLPGNHPHRHAVRGVLPDHSCEQPGNGAGPDRDRGTAAHPGGTGPDQRLVRGRAIDLHGDGGARGAPQLPAQAQPRPGSGDGGSR